MEELNFDKCYKGYVEFLYLCRQEKTKVIVPSKLADFMWHSHMQDHEAYKEDTRKIMGEVLNHRDDFSTADLERHQRETEEARAKLIPQETRINRVDNGQEREVGGGGYGYGMLAAPIVLVGIAGGESGGCPGGTLGDCGGWGGCGSSSCGGGGCGGGCGGCGGGCGGC
jgi:hypothetical protein